jgi:DNA-binding winged helix-turn-helix (wHTH) protein/dipeptidyl aminopeptidase/acylaminoacyl peptidase
MATWDRENLTYEFGPFRLDPAERLLLGDGQVVSLTPKAFDLLVYLVERHGRLVEKQSLMTALWPDTVVEEANLAYNVSALRKALDDASDGESLIQTVPTRGYRFVGRVATQTPDVTSEPRGARRHGARAEHPVVEARLLSTLELVLGRLRRNRRTTIAVTLFGVVAAGPWTTTKWSARNRPVSTRLSVGNLTRLTFDPGLQIDVTWSPDGSSIAYASDKAGSFDVWVKRVADTEAIQITRSPAQDTQPTWSPDGRTIVFRSDRDGGGLFAVPAEGGAERRLTTFGVRPKWAPDGSQILFGSTDTRFASEVSTRLDTVGLDGSSPREVLRDFLDDGLRVGRWVWYHDSRRVSVLAQNRNREEGVFTLPLAGGQPKLLKLDPALSFWQWFEWRDGGRTLYVERGEPEHVRSVFRLTVDPVGMQIVAAQRLFTGDAGVGVDASTSPDGTRLAIARVKIVFNAANLDEPGELRIAVVPSTGGGRSQWTLLTPAHAWADKPRWSPDGRRVYFTRWDGSFWNLWSVRFDPTRGKPVGHPIQVTHFYSPSHQISPWFQSAEVGVSANRLVLTMMQQTGNIWMLDNVHQ